MDHQDKTEKKKKNPNFKLKDSTENKPCTQAHIKSQWSWQQIAYKPNWKHTMQQHRNTKREDSNQEIPGSSRNNHPKTWSLWQT